MRALASLLEHALSGAAEFFAPSRCAACDEPLPRRALFCDACEPGPGPLLAESLPCGLRVAALASYEGALRTAVQSLKYGGRPDLARGLGERLGTALARQGLEADLVVPVPLHPLRLAARGYNQSALLARGVARVLGARVDPRALARNRVTLEQASLGRRARAENVVGAFAAGRRLRGERVVLVDDVVTTGATAVAAAAALLLAGAGTVSIAAVLRADTRRGRSGSGLPEPREGPHPGGPVERDPRGGAVLP